MLVAVEDLDVHNLAAFTVGQAQRRVFDLARFLAEDGPKQFLFRRQFGLTLGRNLADQDVARRHFGADADDALFVQILERVFAHVGDVTRDLFRTKLGLPGIHLVLLDVDGRIFVVLHQPFAHQDGVLEVAAFPAHVGHDHVLAQGQLAALGAGTIGQHRAGVDHVALEDDRALVNAGALVAAIVLAQMIRAAGAVFFLHHDLRTGRTDHLTGLARRHHLARVDGRLPLHAGADHRRFGPHQRHCLALHVGAHERAVGVVVLQERNQRSRYTHDLLG